MDSSGLGIIVSHMVHCNKKGMKMIAAGIQQETATSRRSRRQWMNFALGNITAERPRNR